jgi:hypothetical protein
MQANSETSHYALLQNPWHGDQASIDLGIFTLKRDQLGGVPDLWNARPEIHGLIVELWQDGGTTSRRNGGPGSADIRVHALREFCSGHVV